MFGKRSGNDSETRVLKSAVQAPEPASAPAVPREVAAPAVQAHVDHGDTVGFCPCRTGCLRFITTEGESVCVLQFNRGPLQPCSSSSECPDEFPNTFPTCATLDGDTATGNVCTLFARLC